MNKQQKMIRAISKNKFMFLFSVFVFILVGAVVMKTFNPFQKQPATVKKTVIKQVLMKRSIDKGIVNRGLTGKNIDVSTGKIIAAARIFSPTDKTVYLELDFTNAPKGLVIDYIRYRDGRYVDHGEVALAKANTNNLLFTWTINQLLSGIRDGNWKVATYTDGILAKRIAYEIKKDKVASVYPDRSEERRVGKECRSRWSPY